MKSVKSFRVIFGLVVAIMLAISYLTYRSLNNMIQDAQDVEHTNVVMRELEKVISEVKDAESAHRGYQLTSDSAFLEPYFNSKWIALSKIDLVDSLVSDNARQKTRVDSLRELVINQYSIIENIIEDMSTKNQFEATENTLLAKGNKNMAAIRKQVDTMTDSEWKLLIARTNRQDYSSMVTPLLIFMSFILAIIAIAYLFTQLYKTLRIKVLAEHELENNLKQISQEVNEKMRARESLQKVMDSSPNGILFMEAIRENGEIVDFRYQLGNRAVERLLQRPLESFLGKTLLEEFPSALESGAYENYVDTTDRGIAHSMETFYNPNENHEIWIEESCVKLDDGCVITLVDTTVHKKANFIIEEGRKKFEAIFNNTFQYISLLDYRGVIMEANEAFLDFGGFEPEDLIGHNLWDVSLWIQSSKVTEDIREIFNKAQSGNFVREEVSLLDSEGITRTVDFSLKPIFNEGMVSLIVFEGRDITELKFAEEERSFVSQLNLIIADSSTFDEAVISVFEKISQRYNMDYAEVWLPFEGQMYLSELHYAVDDSFEELHTNNLRLDINKGEGMIGRVMNTLEMEFIEDISQATNEEFIKKHKAAEYGLKMVFAVPIIFNNELILTATFFSKDSSSDIDPLRRTILQVSSSIGALLIKKKVHDDLEKNNKILASAEHIANMGSWEWYLPKNSVKWSSGVYKIYDRPASFVPTYESFFVNHIHPEDLARVTEEIEKARTEITGYDIVFRLVGNGGTIKYIRALATYELDELGRLETFYGAIQDITQQKNFEYNLVIKNEELQKSNENLEQFAYVASHDLQEPLRKIRAFGDRLVTKYEAVLEEKGADYISRMQSAAARMQSLIDDLLKYSRVARNQEPFKPIILNELVDEVKGDLETRILETKATIDVGELPEIEGDSLQLRQLFQNLMSNALKFTPPERMPHIEVSANAITGTQVQKKYNFNVDSSKQFTEIKISDNGIGFDKKYSDRIFNIFERLHGRNEFQGTGIGLAICLKVVQNHNGLISADSVEGEGATFTIVLPLK
ncbi:CHASE3 domain-containing protein [Fulvivirga maritima]|uniref:CHASE3 domain-containing protein n=1 Tax=Fulvivirga maritima TaxID=2904247 RepID=UPI001F3FB3B8|nr:CHASE3 domain-containing protein [Fulvivirga maritima]UII26463.1 CHASE3 domain-containing protein [Fulvivirga maritima]